MKRRDDPFAGIDLSEQAGLDQRLFVGEEAPTPPAPPPDIPSSKRGSPETSKPASQEAGNEGRRETSREGGKEAGREAFPPGEKEAGKEASHEARKEASQEAVREGGREAPLPELPVFKNSFLYTEEESNLFDDIKLDMRRRLGRKASKNDIARAAIRFLAQDYNQNPQDSFLVRNLPRK